MPTHSHRDVPLLIWSGSAPMVRTFFNYSSTVFFLTAIRYLLWTFFSTKKYINKCSCYCYAPPSPLLKIVKTVCILSHLHTSTLRRLGLVDYKNTNGQDPMLLHIYQRALKNKYSFLKVDANTSCVLGTINSVFSVLRCIWLGETTGIMDVRIAHTWGRKPYGKKQITNEIRRSMNTVKYRYVDTWLRLPDVCRPL